jgi:uncharacterized SAM-binding protein YcdF (DUF218 family)
VKEQSEITAPTRRGRRWLRAIGALVLVAGVFYVVSPTVLTAVGEQLIHVDPLERADAIIVLASRLERIIEAAGLYQQGYAPMVLLTREQRDSAEQLLIDRKVVESGEEQRRQVLIALGVPADAIVLLDDLVTSTVDEARAFAGWARSHPVRRLIVVTSPIHTARARLTFARALEHLPVTIIVRPASMARFQSATWWRARDTLRDGVLEWQKLLYYRLVELPRLTPVTPTS